MDRDSRRLPAFGRDLLLARRRNLEPEVVHVLVGDDWTRTSIGCYLALRAEHWQPGRIDWTPCAGLPVIVHERMPYPRSTAPHATSLVERVGAELAWCAAMVELHFSNNERWEIERWAQFQRLDRPDRSWPDWWSDAHANRAARARQTYLGWLAGLRNERFLPIAKALL